MARKQSHEDYLINKDKATQLNAITDDISAQYSGDPAQKEVFRQRLLAQGVPPEKVEAMIPRDRTYADPGQIADRGQSIGQLDGQDVYLPQTAADITPGKTRTVPGMGAGYELKLKGEESKVRHRVALEDIANAKQRWNVRLATDPSLARNQLIAAQINKANAAAAESKAMLEAGYPEARVASLRATAEKARQDVEDALSLSPEALNMATEQYLRTGQLPPLRGKQGVAMIGQIINNAPGVAANRGLSSNIAENAAQFKTDTQSEGGIKKMYDAVSSFEGMAAANLNALEKMAEKVPDYGSPVLNKAIRSAKKTGLGDPDVNNFDAQRVTTLTEIARVVNNPNLTGVMAESARHEIENLLSPGATLEQVRAAKTLFLNEMARRKKYLQEQLAEIQGRRVGGGGAQSQPAAKGNPPSTPGAQVGDRATNNKTGVTWTWNGSAWE